MVLRAVFPIPIQMLKSLRAGPWDHGSNERLKKSSRSPYFGPRNLNIQYGPNPSQLSKETEAHINLVGVRQTEQSCLSNKTRKDHRIGVGVIIILINLYCYLRGFLCLIQIFFVVKYPYSLRLSRDKTW